MEVARLLAPVAMVMDANFPSFQASQKRARDATGEGKSGALVVTEAATVEQQLSLDNLRFL